MHNSNKILFLIEKREAQTEEVWILSKNLGSNTLTSNHLQHDPLIDVDNTQLIKHELKTLEDNVAKPRELETALTNQGQTNTNEPKEDPLIDIDKVQALITMG